MSISLPVKGVSQDLDFATGAMTNFVVLELPDGRAFRAAVEDEVAQAIISAATNGASAAAHAVRRVEAPTINQQQTMQEELKRLKQQVAQHDPMRDAVDEDGQLIMEFGGDEQPEELVPTRSRTPKLTPEQVMKGRQVPDHLIDEMGNLTEIPGGGGVDPGEVVSMDDADEDGTESI